MDQQNREGSSREDPLWEGLPRPGPAPAWDLESALDHCHQILRGILQDDDHQRAFGKDASSYLADLGLAVPQPWAAQATYIRYEKGDWLAAALAGATPWQVSLPAAAPSASPGALPSGLTRLELWLAARGEKPVSRWMVEERNLPSQRALLDDLGLAYIISPYKMSSQNHPDKRYSRKAAQWHPPEAAVSGSLYYLWCSANPDWAKLGYLFELLNLSWHLGCLFGYPACCIHAVMQRPYDTYEQTMGDFSCRSITHTTDPPPYAPVVNTFLRFWGNGAISHFPCSYTCQASVDLGERYLTSYAQGDPGRAEDLRQKLRSAALMCREQGLYVLGDVTRISGTVVQYNPAPNKMLATETSSDTYHLIRNYTQIEWLGPFQSVFSAPGKPSRTMSSLAAMIFK